MNFLTFQFKKHFLELKFKLLYSFLTIIFTTIACYLKIYPILYIFSKYLLYNINSSKFFFSNIVQIFFTYLEISFYISVIVCFPFLLLNFLQYFIIGLYRFEFIFCLKTIFFSFFSFFFSIFFTYILIFPNFLTFFLNFESSNHFFPIFFEAKFDEYFFFVLNIFIKSIFIFQIPLIIFIFIKINFIKFSIFFIKRNYFYIFLLFFSAIINPPELILQIIFFFFSIIMFEFFIFINIFFFYCKKFCKLLP